MGMQRKVWIYSGDADPLGYGGLWMRHVDAGRWHVVELLNMDDACGSDNEGHPKYAGELAEVNTDDSTNAMHALRSCGWDDRDDDGRPIFENGEVIPPAAIAESMFRYGCKAPLWNEGSNNAHALIREGKRYSRELEGDPEAYAERMARPVNALGSTAAEFARGELAPALARGLEAGDPAARLVAKMYRACDGRTLGGEIDAETRKVVGL